MIDERKNKERANSRNVETPEYFTGFFEGYLYAQIGDFLLKDKVLKIDLGMAKEAAIP